VLGLLDRVDDRVRVLAQLQAAPHLFDRSDKRLQCEPGNGCKVGWPIVQELVSQDFARLRMALRTGGCGGTTVRKPRVRGSD
jgi:hypothetical protein